MAEEEGVESDTFYCDYLPIADLELAGVGKGQLVILRPGLTGGAFMEMKDDEVAVAVRFPAECELELDWVIKMGTKLNPSGKRGPIGEKLSLYQAITAEIKRWWLEEYKLGWDMKKMKVAQGWSIPPAFTGGVYLVLNRPEDLEKLGAEGLKLLWEKL